MKVKKDDGKRREERGREGEALQKELILSRGCLFGGQLMFSVFFGSVETRPCPIS